MNLFIWLFSACYRSGDQLLSGSPLEGSKGSQAGTHNTGVAGRETGGGGRVFQPVLLEAKGKQTHWE